MYCVALEAESNSTGLSIAGLPTLAYSSGEGLQYGGRAFLYQYGDGSVQPYKWNLVMNYSVTTEQRRDIFVFWDVPEIIGPNSRFDIFFDSKRFVYDDYLGIGNDIDYHREFKEADDALFIDENYYKYKRKWLAVMAKLQFPLFRDGLKGLAGLGYYDTDVANHEGTTLYDEESPFGIEGGISNYFQLGVVYDQRDSESVPSKGFWTEFLIEKSVKALGGEYSYWRATFTDRRYFSLHPRLVYAQRLMFETMPGDPPFYEMSFFSSSYQRREGLGGGYSLRGLPRFFLIGPNKFMGNFELRCRVLKVTILKQDFTSYIHGFVDAGRIWLNEEKKTISDFHFTRGMGLHVKWNKDFVGALDIGYSKYRSFAIYATFGNLF